MSQGGGGNPHIPAPDELLGGRKDPVSFLARNLSAAPGVLRRASLSVATTKLVSRIKPMDCPKPDYVWRPLLLHPKPFADSAPSGADIVAQFGSGQRCVGETCPSHHLRK